MTAAAPVPASAAVSGYQPSLHMIWGPKDWAAVLKQETELRLSGEWQARYAAAELSDTTVRKGTCCMHAQCSCMLTINQATWLYITQSTVLLQQQLVESQLMHARIRTG